MSYVDWKGVSMAIAQLKELTEPNRMELMEREYELRAIENEKDRAFEQAKYRFDYWQDTHNKNAGKIDELEKNIRNMNASALKLKPEEQSTQFSDIVESTDITTKNSLQTNNAHLEAAVGTQMTYLTELSDLYNNMMYGKQLRESQGGDKFRMIKEPRTDGESSWEEDVAWDYDADGTISPEENEKALNSIINMMANENQNTVGIREGFYSGYNPQDEKRQNVQHKRNLLALQEDEKTAGMSEDEKILQKAKKKKQLDDVVDKLNEPKEQEEAFEDYFKYGQIYLNARQDTNTGSETFDVNNESGTDKGSWEIAKSKYKKASEVLGVDIVKILAPNKNLEGGYINDDDWIDHGFNSDLEKTIINAISGANPVQLNPDPTKNRMALLASKNFLNQIVEDWGRYPDDMSVEEIKDFEKKYSSIKRAFPDHFKDLGDPQGGFVSNVNPSKFVKE
tara:strand:+ start:15214 stop:16566 length:1353 start_codon:yes stop_codon:yes gene_type:complete